jgi:hypothetical protein
MANNVAHNNALHPTAAALSGERPRVSAIVSCLTFIHQ